jgi:hypothetical protein
VTITLEQAQANGGWYIEIAAPTSSITYVVPEYGELLQQIDDWSVVEGGRGSWRHTQQELVTSLDSRHIYFTWDDDGDYVNTAEYGPSDPPYAAEWSPYGSPSPTANRRPFPAPDHRTAAGR